MSNFVLLNNITHKNLKVVVDHAAQYGDNEMFAVTFPQEFRAVQDVYPIFFQKDFDNGKFFSVALFGLRENENLFLSDKGWGAPYIPLSVKRRPFLIGVQPNNNNDPKNNMSVYVDSASPRLSSTDGEAVFLPHGGYSPYLEKVVSMLEYIHIGTETNQEFINALLQYDLLEPITLDIELSNGSNNKLVGFYTVNEDKLQSLDGDSLAALHKQGYLLYIYMVLASMSNVSGLIERMEAKLKSE